LRGSIQERGTSPNLPGGQQQTNKGVLESRPPCPARTDIKNAVRKGGPTSFISLREKAEKPTWEQPEVRKHRENTLSQQTKRGKRSIPRGQNVNRNRHLKERTIKRKVGPMTDGFTSDTGVLVR